MDENERERHEAGGYGQSVEATSLAACHRPPPFLLTRQQASDSEENNLLEFSQNARSSKIMVIYLTKFTAVSSQ